MLRALMIGGLAALLALPARAGCPAGPVPSLALPATGAALAAGRSVTILAFGSSSTEGFAASGPGATYPARLEARLREALPGRPIAVLNRGRGGEEVQEMMLRLKRDVLDAAPTLVVWQVGSNAVLRGVPPETYRARVEAGLDQLRAAGIEVILMDGQEAPRMEALPEAKARIEALTADIARDRGVPLFARGALMRGWRQDGVPDTAVIGPDGLHHTDFGYDCVAAALADGIAAAVRPAPGVALSRAPAAAEAARPR
ncbi:SGNH/GDSL hydrolase family protein [Muricoccus nepalensis]|nr:SGNH/GDSL hydrolase family protein [Roseomonas nepalensis]